MRSDGIGVEGPSGLQALLEAVAHGAEDGLCSPGGDGLAVSLQEPSSTVNIRGLQASAQGPRGVWPQPGSERTSFFAPQSGFANERALVFVRRFLSKSKSKVLVRSRVRAGVRMTPFPPLHRRGLPSLRVSRCCHLPFCLVSACLQGVRTSKA